MTTTFMSLVVLAAGGGAIRQMGPVAGWILLAALVLLTGVLTHRMKDSIAPQVVVVMIGVALASGPIVDGVASIAGYGTSVMSEPQSLSVQLVSQPDVFLVVLDGFPGIATLDADIGAHFGASLADRLQSNGLVVPSSVTAAYPATNYSIPSILQMDYPITQISETDATLQDLYDVISGNSQLRRLLSDNGYDTTMIEAGWSGSSCRAWYDNCVASHWLDDPMYHVLRSTSVGASLLPVTAFHYGIASKATMEWLAGNLPSMSTDNRPQFVFAHVLAPHAPFFLREDCSLDLDPEREGFFFRRPGTPDAERNKYLVDQITCLESFMVSLNESIEGDAVLVFVSDHGTDRHDQTARDPASWTSSEYHERMSAFLAARIPSDCSIGDEVHLPNVMRRVTSCLAETPLAGVPVQSYLFNRDWDAG